MTNSTSLADAVRWAEQGIASSNTRAASTSRDDLRLILDALEQSQKRERELVEAGQRAIQTLAASRHLIGKYTPDHHWIPEHDQRIAELRKSIDRVSNDQG